MKYSRRFDECLKVFKRLEFNESAECVLLGWKVSEAIEGKLPILWHDNTRIEVKQESEREILSVRKFFNGFDGENFTNLKEILLFLEFLLLVIDFR